MRSVSEREKIKAGIFGRRSAYSTARRKAFLAAKRRMARHGAVKGDYSWRMNRLVVKVPEVLDLLQHRSATLDVAASCRTNCLVHAKRTLLDFTATKVISSAAILFLVAEIDRCRKVAGVAILSGTYPKDKRLNRQMRDTGFYDALGVKVEGPKQERGFPVEYIKVQSGTQADGRMAVGLRQALLGPLEAQLEKEKRGSFFRGLTEAMTNVSQHAYPDDWHTGPIKVIKKGWWMLGHINKLSKQLKIMIVDQGIGIPRSLPRNHRDVLPSLLAMLNLDSTDGAMIHAAMELGRSRLEQSHRGKGLNDLKQIIDLCQAGTLRILSKKGEYQYRVHAGKSISIVNAFEDSLNGTFVEWSIPLDAILPFLLVDETGNEEK
jgi:anti-anti-sigma regulatory factor